MDNQPLARLVQMEAALYAYESLRARRQALDQGVSAVKFSKAHPELVEYCAAVDHLREYGRWPNEESLDEG